MFKQSDLKSVVAKKNILDHIFYWFSYCRRWKFPFSDVNLDLRHNLDVPELIISLIGRHILSVISQSPISLYQELQESLVMPRGRTNFTRYINAGLSNGNYHILECDHEPLLFDNKLNRVIKYVARLLQNKAKFSETRYVFDEIIFLLDDVTDQPCTIVDLNAIKLNSFFSEYETVLGFCRIVLEQQLYSADFYRQPQWCILFPMEYIFEDFVAGFLEAKFSDKWEVHMQKSDLYLSTDPQAFQMRHDILLVSKLTDRKIIIDTKYKLRYPDSRNDTKKGVSQVDMYQMVSYSMRRRCTDVLLLYPNFTDELQLPNAFKIVSGFNSNDVINVVAAEIPFWSSAVLDRRAIDHNLSAFFEKILSKY